MVRVLLVTGDDYAAMALAFEHSEVSVEEALAMAELGGGETTLCIEGNDVKVAAHTIEGEVSDEFVTFIKRYVIDYGAGKHTNFYVINEEDGE